MQQAQGQNGPMDSNSLNFRSIVKTLEVVVKHEENEEKKATCNRVLERFIETKNSSLLKELDRQNQQRLVEIRTMLKLYRNAFEKITQKEQYRQFKIPDGRIAQHLLNLQQKIDPKDYKASYLRAITIKKKEFNWTKELIQDWMKAFEEERVIEEQKNKQKQMDRNKEIKSQPLPNSIPPQTSPAQLVQLLSQSAQNAVPQPSPIKLQQKKPSQRPAQKSTQKITGQKPEKKLKKDDTGDKPQKQKKAPKPKKQADESESSDNETAKQTTRKRQEKQQKDRMQRYEKPKQPKNRVKALMEYLAARKDFSSISSSQHKLKEMAEFLNQNLEKFMKHHLTNLIQIAKLKNKRHQTLASSGNEFTYFSRDGYTSLKPINHLQVSQQPARMLKLNYRSKFELYSMLRSREQVLEEALLKQFASKKDAQNNKQSDKRLWEYLLRPSHLVEKAEQYTEMEEARTDRLSIEITHIRYLFQAHKFIRNSWLMMNCYNS